MSASAFLAAPLPPSARGAQSHLRNSSPCRRRRCAAVRACAGAPRASPAASEHERYLRDVARAAAPAGLDALLRVLERAGEKVVLPGVRDAVHPFLVPLTRAPCGAFTGLLRWPTAPETMDLPVARTVNNSLALSLQSPSALAHVRRKHAEADYAGRHADAAEIRALAPDAGCKADEVAASGAGSLERFLVMHVASFPDVYEGLAEFHFAKGDEQSALVTCERANVLFPGWASPHVFYARMMGRMGRESEARDAARFALQMPLWTMGGTEEVREMGRLAGYVDESSLEKIYRRLFEDTREKEVAEGKAPEQVALDRAAYFLDWATARGEKSWADVDLEKLAELYDEAKMEDIATFVRY